MKHKDIYLIYAFGAVAFVLLFMGIRFVFSQMLKSHHSPGYGQIQETQDNIRRSIKETNEKQDALMDAQEQKLSEYESQQRKTSTNISDTRYRQKTLMQDQQQRIKDLQRH